MAPSSLRLQAGIAKGFFTVEVEMVRGSAVGLNLVGTVKLRGQVEMSLDIVGEMAV